MQYSAAHTSQMWGTHISDTNHNTPTNYQPTKKLTYFHLTHILIKLETKIPFALVALLHERIIKNAIAWVNILKKWINILMQCIKYSNYSKYFISYTNNAFNYNFFFLHCFMALIFCWKVPNLWWLLTSRIVGYCGVYEWGFSILKFVRQWGFSFVGWLRGIIVLAFFRSRWL